MRTRPLLGDADFAAGVAVAIKQDIGFGIEDQRPLGSHHDFAPSAEAVAIYRRIRHDHSLIGILFKPGNATVFGRIVFDAVIVANVERGGVLRTRELKHAIHMVFDFAIRGHDVTAADSMNAERMDFLAIIAQ